MTRLEELVNKVYDNLNENEIRIWKYIFNNKKECSNLSIEVLAKKCWCSRSSIMRFSQKIGLSGFSELKTYLKWELNNIQSVKYLNDSILEKICEKNIKTIKNFQETNYDNLCEVILKAKRIFLYGTGSAQKSLCGEFSRIMLTIGIILEIIPGQGEFRKIIPYLSDSDVVFIISKSGESEFIREITCILENKNIILISLTNYGNSTLAKRSKYNLFVEGEIIKVTLENNYDSMISFFLVLEILFLKILEYKES